jgi:ribosome-associated heat shock protein Hsp15
VVIGSADRRSRDDDEAGGSEEGAGQRLDKWLWFVRAIKSRTQAAALVTEGKVRVNRERASKPSQTLRPGDVVTITVRGHVRVLRMIGAGHRRGPATEAQALCEDLTPPPVPRSSVEIAAAASGVRAPGTGRPTKKERRQLDRIKGGD